MANFLDNFVEGKLARLCKREAVRLSLPDELVLLQARQGCQQS